MNISERNKARAKSVDHTFFSEINTEAKAWCLGLMFSDGNVSKSKAEIWLCMSDLDVIEKFRSCIQSESKIHKHPKKDESNKQLYRLVFTSHPIKADLIRHGCTPAKSMTLKYPVELNTGYERHFIRGIFDGDGSVTVTSKTKQASIAGTVDIVEWIHVVLNHNGIGSSIFVLKSGTAILSLHTKSNNLIKFREYLYSGATLWMDRKFNKFNQLITK